MCCGIVWYTLLLLYGTFVVAVDNAVDAADDAGGKGNGAASNRLLASLLSSLSSSLTPSCESVVAEIFCALAVARLLCGCSEYGSVRGVFCEPLSLEYFAVAGVPLSVGVFADNDGLMYFEKEKS